MNSTLHPRQSSTQSDKYQVSHRYSYFSWRWAQSRPKLVEKEINILVHQVGFIYNITPPEISVLHASCKTVKEAVIFSEHWPDDHKLYAKPAIYKAVIILRRLGDCITALHSSCLTTVKTQILCPHILHFPWFYILFVWVLPNAHKNNVYWILHFHRFEVIFRWSPQKCKIRILMSSHAEESRQNYSC